MITHLRSDLKVKKVEMDLFPLPIELRWDSRSDKSRTYDNPPQIGPKGQGVRCGAPFPIRLHPDIKCTGKFTPDGLFQISSFDNHLDFGPRFFS